MNLNAKTEDLLKFITATHAVLFDNAWTAVAQYAASCAYSYLLRKLVEMLINSLPEPGNVIKGRLSDFFDASNRAQVKGMVSKMHALFHEIAKFVVCQPEFPNSPTIVFGIHHDRAGGPVDFLLVDKANSAVALFANICDHQLKGIVEEVAAANKKPKSADPELLGWKQQFEALSNIYARLLKMLTMLRDIVPEECLRVQEHINSFLIEDVKQLGVPVFANKKEHALVSDINKVLTETLKNKKEQHGKDAKTVDKTGQFAFFLRVFEQMVAERVQFDNRNASSS
jgi:hypothetical protein